MSSNKTRREFVKQTGILAGGIFALPNIAGANYFSGAEDTIKVALIGCGGRGTGAAMQALSTKQNVKLVAMADAFRDRLDDCYKTLISEDSSDGSGGKNLIKNRIDVSEERKFIGFDAFQKAIPFADVVILATPPGFRPIHFEAAIKNNKHVFMEKPVATDPAGVKKVLEAAACAETISPILSFLL